MDTLLQFLSLILPSEGWFCAVVIVNGKFHHQFVKTHEQLARILLDADARGLSVYHGCASFKEPTRRLKTNVHLIKSLWMEIDFERKIPGGENVLVYNPKDAVAAVFDFTLANRLPNPLYVGSGGGLHLYWPLAAPVDRVEWQHYAQGLRAVARKGGLQFDPQRTCDEASILRPPGSHNFKYGEPREVRCHLQGAVASDLHEFLPIRQALIDRVKEDGFGEVPAHLKHIKPITGYTVEEQWEPSDANKIASNCRQLGDFRDLGGRLSEPHWFAGLSVLAFCEGGDRYGHEWSKGDSRYSFEDTQSRLERSREMSGPGTCQRFAEVNPEGCEGCPHRGHITTPLELGRTVAKANPDAGERGRSGGLNGHHVTLPAILAERAITLPEGYEMHDTGLYKSGDSRWIKGGTEQDPPKLIVSHPFFLSDIQSGEAFSYVFALKKPLKKEWEDFTLSAETSAGMNALAKVRGKGIAVQNGDLFKQYLIDAHTHLENMKVSAVQHDQNGWSEGGFVWGKRKYIDGLQAPAALSAFMTKRAKEYFQSKGTMEEWQIAAQLMLGAGSKEQAFAFLCSCAAPLMRFESPQEGGAIISLVSQASSRGKTTALQLGASVWAAPRGLNMVNDDTYNAKMAILGTANNLPAFYDEIVSQKPLDLKDLVTTYSEGTERARATTTGELQREPWTWNNMLITSSNRSLVDIVNSISPSNAPAFRIMEFTLSDRLVAPPAGGSYFGKTFAANYGHLGHVLLSYYTNPQVLPRILKLIDEGRDIFRKRYGFEEPHRFWYRALSCCYATAEILDELHIIKGVHFASIVLWAARNQIATKQAATGKINYESHSSLNSFAKYLADNFRDVLIVDRARTPENEYCTVLQEPRNAVIGRLEQKEQMLYLSDAHLENWCVENNVNGRELLRELKTKKIVIGQKRMNLTEGTKFPASGQLVLIIDHALYSKLPQSSSPAPSVPPQE